MFRRFNLIEPKEMEVLGDLEAALHLTDDTISTSTNAAQQTPGSVASNNSSSSVSSISNQTTTNSNTMQMAGTQNSSPARSGGLAVAPSSSSLSSQIDVNVIVKQPVSSGDGAMNNNNDVSMKDRLVTPPI